MTGHEKRFPWRMAAAALTVAGLGVAGGAASAADVTLRLHQFLPATSGGPKLVLEPWAEKIEAESGGRIEIQLFPSMQLGGKPPDLIDQAIDGVVDIVWTLPGYTPGRFPRTEVFELPFTMTDAAPASRAYWRLAEETMMDSDFRDVKVLGLWVHGPGIIHSKKPVESVGDLNGIKLRAPSRITNRMFGDLGATPVGMPAPAVPEALSKGVIDAAVLPWEVTGALKIAELAENHTGFGDEALYTATFILAMNRDSYDALPGDLKAVIDANSGLEFSGEAGHRMEQGDDGPRDAAVAAGANIVEVSGSGLAEWKDAALPTIAAWISEMDDKGLDGTGLRRRALELIAEETAR
ncbi:TRAP transporter substrate-binding protein [Tropicimonas sp.]|uniref:TRAP transporter substrate-binding protein n=1 Tax=Tropicimonas sp. TaxID=2067044 RepID=UPI003A8541EF